MIPKIQLKPHGEEYSQPLTLMEVQEILGLFDHAQDLSEEKPDDYLSQEPLGFI